MESTLRWIAVAVGAAALALGACSATGPARTGEPELRFSSPADGGSERRGEHDAPARVRRDAHGRPIHFREIRLDRHGAARDTGAADGAVCGARARCVEAGDGAGRGGSGNR